MYLEESKKNEVVWQEKYRPSRVEDLIIPKDAKDKFKSYVLNDALPNMGFFSNSPGTGKTSSVYALLKELDCESIFINASLNNGIDTLRGKIMNFAAQQSFDNKRKVVVMDEFDNFSSTGMAAFRSFLDEFSTDCAFIFTGNYKEKIISPLLDRLDITEFDTFSKAEMVKPIFERLSFILTHENKEFNKEDLVGVINTFYPSVRAMIGAIQRYSVGGTLSIPEGELDNADKFTKLITVISEKKFSAMIEAVNAISAPDSFYGWCWKNINKHFEKENLPKAVMILAKYQDYATRAVDKNLNLGAACTELMMQCQVKA